MFSGNTALVVKNGVRCRSFSKRFCNFLKKNGRACSFVCKWGIGAVLCAFRGVSAPRFEHMLKTSSGFLGVSTQFFRIRPCKRVVPNYLSITPGIIFANEEISILYDKPLFPATRLACWHRKVYKIDLKC